MKSSLFRPLKALAFLGREPVTLPMEPRPAAPQYRGFHLNDWEACIGCGTCEKICDNAAIRMVEFPDLADDPLKGIKPRRPAIDYGRCCWCALCVDICPTGSIALSREYVHVDADLNTFFILPDEQGIHGEGFAKGWAKSDDADLLDHHRQPMAEAGADERIADFREIVEGYDDQRAVIEASRCIQCGMCHDACPAHMHAPEYIRALWNGDIEEAVRQIYRTNPLPSVCGRICTHRCETACSMHHRGDPIAIRWLKRYAMDQADRGLVQRIAEQGQVGEASGRRVAIIGSGPGGLTAAYDLARAGHAVTIFEAQPEPGGMMRYGIPEYRLPYDKLDEDIQVIRDLGVEIRCNTRVGKEITLDSLKQEYDGVVLAIGLHLGRSTRIPGSEHPQVFSAVDLLARITRGEGFPLPQDAVVIGGGNVAMDIARSVARMQHAEYGRVGVTLTALEKRDQMLADEEEIREAEEEGVCIFPGRGPQHCVVDADRLTGLKTVACLSIFDEQGRFHPKYDETDEMVFQGDMVIEAIGQMPDLSMLDEQLNERLKWAGRRIAVDADGHTSEPWLWAVGDLVQGPDVIHAIADGHRAADSVHKALMGSTAQP